MSASSQADRLDSSPPSLLSRQEGEDEVRIGARDRIQRAGLDPGSGDLAAYQLSSATKKVKKKVGTTYEPIRLISCCPASSPMTASVSLLPSTKPNLAQYLLGSDPVAADLTDVLGRPLDGNDDGQPGGDFAATFSRQGIAFGEPSNKLAARIGVRWFPATGGLRKEDVIDVSLVCGDLVGVQLAPALGEPMTEGGRQGRTGRGQARS